MADLKVFSAGVAMRPAKQAVEAFETANPGLPPLKDGEYRFIYLSGPSMSGADYAKLPPEMSQGDPAYEDLYNSVTFTVDGGKVVKGTTILHAIMISKKTAHREAAEAFVKQFLETDFTALGFTPVQKAVGDWTL